MLLPLLFAAVCAYMLWSSLVYVKAGALVGVGVLALGEALTPMRVGAAVLIVSGLVLMKLSSS